MAMNTKQKYLGRSRLSLIFGSWLKLAAFMFFDKNSFRREKLLKKFFKIKVFMIFISS
jgi:hypothetical protein